MHAAIAFLINILIDLFIWVVIIQAVLSWLFNFGIINPHNRAARQIYDGLTRLTEPVFAPIRNILPAVGGLDLSPIVVLIGIQFIRTLLRSYGII